MIKVVLIGSGNVAKNLFDVFSKNEAIEMVQVVSRNAQALKNFATTVNFTTDFSEIEKADIYIIAVSDDAIGSVSKQLTTKKGLVVHTSGSMPISILSNHVRYGVFYPLQTFSKNRKVVFKNVPFCIEATNDPDLSLLKKLARQFSEKVFEVSSEQRKSLHLAAVFVNNFANHLYHIGNMICEANNLPFEILNPLIKETVNKIEKLSPFDAQTGPARRNDVQTINTHLDQLEDSDVKEIYTVLSQSIQKFMEKSYKEYLKDIDTFVFDVDGVFTDSTLIITTDGEMLRKMSVKDGYALKTALQKGYKVCIISGGTNEGVRNRLKALGVTDIYLGADHKMDALEEYMDIYDIAPSSMLYMGDDIPDIPPMQTVALPTCPQNAVPEVKAISKYVSHKNGGEGCVRDVIEQVLKVRGDWLGNSAAND